MKLTGTQFAVIAAEMIAAVLATILYSVRPPLLKVGISFHRRRTVIHQGRTRFAATCCFLDNSGRLRLRKLLRNESAVHVP